MAFNNKFKEMDKRLDLKTIELENVRNSLFNKINKKIDEKLNNLKEYFYEKLEKICQKTNKGLI